MGFTLWKQGSKFLAEGFGEHEGTYKDRDWSNLATTMAENVDVLDAHRFGEIEFSQEINNSTFIEPIDEETRDSILGVLDRFLNSDSILTRQELREEFD